MKTRIVARYLIKEGYDEIGDRCVDKDTYVEKVVGSENIGIELIDKHSISGIGTIETQQETKYGWWETIEEKLIDEGQIFETKTY